MRVDAGEVHEPGLFDEVPHLFGIVVDAKRPREIERRAVEPGERDRTGRVNRNAVECGAPHEPPVETMADRSRALFERVAGPHAHERLLVVHEIVELLQPEPDVGTARRRRHRA